MMGVLQGWKHDVDTVGIPLLHVPRDHVRSGPLQAFDKGEFMGDVLEDDVRTVLSRLAFESLFDVQLEGFRIALVGSVGHVGQSMRVFTAGCHLRVLYEEENTVLKFNIAKQRYVLCTS